MPVRLTDCYDAGWYRADFIQRVANVTHVSLGSKVEPPPMLVFDRAGTSHAVEHFQCANGARTAQVAATKADAGSSSLEPGFSSTLVALLLFMHVQRSYETMMPCFVPD